MMIRLLALAIAFFCFLIGAVFLVNALMVTFDTVFAGRDATLALAFLLAALLALKAGETIQFAWDDWSTRKQQRALNLLREQDWIAAHKPDIQKRLEHNWMSPYSETDTQEMDRVG